MSELIGLGDLIEDYLGAREAAKALTGDTPGDEFDRIETRYDAAKARLNLVMKLSEEFLYWAGAHDSQAVVATCDPEVSNMLEWHVIAKG